MAPRKHEVDPTTQASMLPLEAGSRAVAGTVELEGAFYKALPEVLTPEQEALKAESSAIYLLGRACETKQTIKSMSKRRYSLEAYDGDWMSDQEEVSKLSAAIERSEEHYSEFRRRAKKYFGQSIGIETVEVEEERTAQSEGTPKKVLVVKAKDPARQAEFVARHRKFDDKYGKPGQGKAREQRRQEIWAIIKPADGKES